MKKFLFLLFLYLLVEGNNVIGDGLYLFHRGSHAVEQLKTKVDNYYPKVKAVDKEMKSTLSGNLYETEDSLPAVDSEVDRDVSSDRYSEEESCVSQRLVIRR